jgi:hypothetical protein
MDKNKLPDHLEFVKVKILGNSSEEYEGSMAMKRWDQKERRSRALRRTGRIVGTVFACSLIGLFVHILLLVIIPTLLLTTVIALPLFFRFMGEESSFFYVEGHCPYCGTQRTLRPYLDTQLRPQVTVQCPECGQTAQAFVK